MTLRFLDAWFGREFRNLASSSSKEEQTLESSLRRRRRTTKIINFRMRKFRTEFQTTGGKTTVNIIGAKRRERSHNNYRKKTPRRTQVPGNVFHKRQKAIYDCAKTKRHLIKRSTDSRRNEKSCEENYDFSGRTSAAAAPLFPGNLFFAFAFLKWSLPGGAGRQLLVQTQHTHPPGS